MARRVKAERCIDCGGKPRTSLTRSGRCLDCGIEKAIYHDRCIRIGATGYYERYCAGMAVAAAAGKPGAAVVARVA